MCSEINHILHMVIKTKNNDTAYYKIQPNKIYGAKQTKCNSFNREQWFANNLAKQINSQSFCKRKSIANWWLDVHIYKQWNQITSIANVFAVVYYSNSIDICKLFGTCH